MIVDRIERAPLYPAVGNSAVAARISLALSRLASHEMESWTLGRHALEGDDVFAIVDAYESRLLDKCFWEAHRKYIDVQYIVCGVEAMDVAPMEHATEIKAYDEAKDFTVLDVPQAHATRLIISAGMFAIFFPTDVHRPCVAPGGVVAPVRKIVVKVRVG